jgi:hypothetical protein
MVTLGAPLSSEDSARISGWRKSEILETLATGTLARVSVSELEVGDVARGVRDPKMITGAPVRILNVKHIGDGRYRVSYHIIGSGWAPGWRNLDGSRSVTLDRESDRYQLHHRALLKKALEA